MRWSFPIARIAGIRIEVHVTFLLLLALAPLLFGPAGFTAPAAVVFALLVFSCVLLHELGHALAALRYGIRTRDITLMFIGGLARLERMPEKPVQEIVVALAGPAVNIAIAAALAGVMAWRHQNWADVASMSGMLERLLGVNIVMVLFNMIPAFPMDGGRVLRALLALRLPYARATRVATMVGQAFALLFAVLGIFVLRNPMLLFVALFVFMAASEERAVVQTRTSVSGLPVRAAMLTSFETLESRDDLRRAVNLLMAGSQQDFPVLEDGRLLGMLSRGELLKGLQQEGIEAPVGRIARLDVREVDANELLESVLSRMREQAWVAAPVTSHGRLVGVLTLENVGEMLLVQEALQRRAGLA